MEFSLANLGFYVDVSDRIYAMSPVNPGIGQQ